MCPVPPACMSFSCVTSKHCHTALFTEYYSLSMVYRAFSIGYRGFLYKYSVAMRLFPRNIGLFSRMTGLFSWDIGIFWWNAALPCGSFHAFYGLFMKRARLMGHISRSWIMGLFSRDMGLFWWNITLQRIATYSTTKALYLVKRDLYSMWT